MVSVLSSPGSCFWELTRRCDFCCGHCRASSTQEPGDELSLEMALDVADQIVALGVRLTILTGGEPTLSPYWKQVARRLADGGVKVRLFTNGFGWNHDMIREALDAGVGQFAVSLDGPEAIHDRLRPHRDMTATSPYGMAVQTIKDLLLVGADLRVVTQVNRINVTHLKPLYKILKELGTPRWQVHLMQPVGRGDVNREELLCEPGDLEKIVEVLLLAAKEKQVLAPLHCTVGYLTAEEPVLRSRELDGPPVWFGCKAGLNTISITADGSVKGCTTLPDEFITGSFRERSLADIWADNSCFPYTRNWDPSVVSGGCGRCAMVQTCRAGCPAVAYGVTGSIGTNPFCLRLVRRTR